jgi:hypothetical protein
MILVIGIPIVLYGLGLYVTGRMWRKRLQTVLNELARAQIMQAALVHRLLIRKVCCEVCHEPIVEPQTVCLRLGPGGYDMFGHAVCFPPM